MIAPGTHPLTPIGKFQLDFFFEAFPKRVCLGLKIKIVYNETRIVIKLFTKALIW